MIWRCAKWLAGILAICVLLVIGALAWLGNSASGTRWVIERGVAFSGMNIQIASIEGSLLHGLILKNLQYQSADQTLSLRRLHLDWSAAALLARELKLNAVELDGLRFRSDAVAEEPSEPFEIPELPIAIRVTKLALTDIEVRSGENSYNIESLHFSGEASGKTLSIETIELNAEGATLNAHGDLSLDDGTLLDLVIALEAERPEFGQVSATAKISGTPKDIVVQAAVSSPFKLDLGGTVQPNGLNTRLALKGLWEDLNWPMQGEASYHSPNGSFLFEGDISALKIELDVALAGDSVPLRHAKFQAQSHLVADKDSYPFESDINWEAQDNKGQTYGGHAHISGDKQHAEFDHALAMPVEISSTGHVDYGQEIAEFELVNRWENLTWPLAENDLLNSAKGELQISGTQNQYAIELDTVVASNSIPETGLTLRSTGNAHTLAIQLLEARTLDGAVRINGSLGWHELVNWDLALVAENINPGVHWSDYPGNLNARAQTSGKLLEGSAEYTLSVSALAGKLREWPVKATANLTGRDKEIQLSKLHFKLGQNSLNASGRIGDQLDLAFTLTAPELHEIMAKADGSLNAKGKITGLIGNPGIIADITGAGVAYQGNKIAMLTAKIDYDPLGKKSSSAHIDIRELLAGSQTISAAMFDASGTSENHRFSSTINADLGSLELHGTGSYINTAWQGKVSRADLLKTQAGDWTLQGPVTIALSDAGANTSEACWAQNEARICALSKADAGGATSASAEAKDLPLTLLSPFLPGGLRLVSDADISASWQKRPGAAEAFKVQLTIPKGVVHYTDEKNVSNELPWEKIEFTAEGINRAIVAELSLVLNDSDFAKARLELDDYQLPSSGISGNLDAQFKKLSLLNPWIPDLEWTSGALDVGAKLNGTLDAPQVSGSATLSNGAIDVRSLGISVEALALSAKAANQTRIDISGSASSGEGRLNISGHVLTDPKLGWPSDIKITGDRFAAARLPEIEVEISPDLNISTDQSGGQVLGRVSLDKLVVKIKKLPESAVSVSDDEILDSTEDGAVTAALKAKWNTRIELEVPSTASLEGFGLNTNMMGTLGIRQEPGAPLSVLGELGLLNGSYKAFGQDLSITRGRFIFSGPSNNPGVDFEAERKATIGDVVAGLRVGGTVKRPITEIYSRPPLPQNEALAYLLLGKPLSSATGGEGNLLANAALTLGARGATPITQRLGKKVGLDELGLQTQGGLEQSGLVLGKQISSRLNLRYVYGLFSRIGGLLLEYRLTESLSLEARAGEAQTVDLLYRHERD